MDDVYEQYIGTSIGASRESRDDQGNGIPSNPMRIPWESHGNENEIKIKPTA